jgi:hypothetical protein
MTKERDPRPQYSFGGDPSPHRPGARRPKRRGAVLATLAVLALAGAGAAYLYVYQPQTVREVLGDSPLAPPPTMTTAYKWQAADGSWHITDSPPAQGTPYETITVTSDTNILPLPPKLQGRN